MELPRFGKEGSGTPVFKILVRALDKTSVLTEKWGMIRLLY